MFYEAGAYGGEIDMALENESGPIRDELQARIDREAGEIVNWDSGVRRGSRRWKSVSGFIESHSGSEGSISGFNETGSDSSSCYSF